MALYTVGSIDSIGDAGFAGANQVTVKKVMQELQQLKRNIAAGFGAAGSVAVSGMSAAGGDTLLSVVITTALGAVDVTDFSSIRNNRIRVGTTSSATKVLNIMWYDRSGNVST